MYHPFQSQKLLLVFFDPVAIVGKLFQSFLETLTLLHSGVFWKWFVQCVGICDLHLDFGELRSQGFGIHVHPGSGLKCNKPCRIQACWDPFTLCRAPEILGIPPIEQLHFRGKRKYVRNGNGTVSQLRIHLSQVSSGWLHSWQPFQCSGQPLWLLHLQMASDCATLVGRLRDPSEPGCGQKMVGRIQLDMPFLGSSKRQSLGSAFCLSVRFLVKIAWLLLISQNRVILWVGISAILGSASRDRFRRGLRSDRPPVVLQFSSETVLPSTLWKKEKRSKIRINWIHEQSVIENKIKSWFKVGALVCFNML